MITKVFPINNLFELSTLGLLHKNEHTLLAYSGITGLSEILDYYKEHQSFYSLDGCSEESAEILKTFSERYIKAVNHKFTEDELFSDAFHAHEDFFVRVHIELNHVSEISRTFLDTWINYVVKW